MTGELVLAILVIALGGAGTWLLLPHRLGTERGRTVHLIGAGLVTLAVLLMAVLWRAPGAGLEKFFFYVFALTAIGAAVLMITARDPIVCALWFAAVVLATAGLFLLAGASFLAAGTVIVYAGAIIVMFLFVIMLAQAGGAAVYDRAARAPLRSTLCCFVLLWALLYSILMVRHPSLLRASEAPGAPEVVKTSDIVSEVDPGRASQVQAVLDLAIRSQTARLPGSVAVRRGVRSSHVAGLGGTLYTDHLVVVELAGALLFVAMVGAAAIAAPRAPARPPVDRAV